MLLDGPQSENRTKEQSIETNEKRKGKKGKKDKEDLSIGHLSILSKFDKYRAQVLGSIHRSDEDAPKSTEPLQGLHPLPLPRQERTAKVDPNSVLPSYLAHPTTVSTSNRPLFSSFNLPAHILGRLEVLNLTHAFPVQSALLPLLLPSNALPSKIKSDILVSAATGSGKTLSYLIPILSTLLNRSISRTYALVIVPTHELASQVQKTAQSLASGTSIKISTAVGTRAFDVEKDYIIPNDTGSTGADILIATPGRLVEHIRNNPKFTLRWLQWLVVDEADRLLSQSFQDWLDIIGDELQKPFSSPVDTKSTHKHGIDIAAMGLRIPKCPADAVRKVILSATMTRDVGKLAGLRLRRPQLIAVDDIGNHEVVKDENELAKEREAMEDATQEESLRDLTALPSTLAENYYSISNTSQKPLVLAKLLAAAPIAHGIIIFTKSNESATRLGRLLELLFMPVRGKKASKVQTPKKWSIAVSTSDKRKREIAANTAKFKSSSVDILISTDLLARGVDLPNAQLVVNYDTPRNEKDYIHRVGRTARAGNSGVAWSLVEAGEAKWWWKAIGKIRRGSGEGVRREPAPTPEEVEVERYEQALETLGKEVRGN
ncbi:hypothetical protein ABW19_dt0203589 [Dactylella cylindrospora]|nr:hypothetical protein ABW19_dt0203589 [Dactylella cylindrospora]